MNDAGSIRLTKSEVLAEGQVVLKRNGHLIWYGLLAQPWDDVDCDEVVVSSKDFESIKQELTEKKT